MQRKLCSAISLMAALFGAPLAMASTSSGDVDRDGEVLASARSLDGNGLVEIVRISEEGVDGVVISRSFPIAIPNTYVPREPNASLSERVRHMYEDITGQHLPEAAREALVEVEIAKEVAARLEVAASLDEIGALEPALQPRAACVDIGAWPYFGYDCYGFGPRVIIKSGTDDVCLLTAAIEGNHTQQISYKAINGKFYNSHKADVLQGHYSAAELKTGVKRTRKAQIYNASASDYSRFAFGGDFKLELFYDPDLSDCEKLTN
jgi:hypothetical protein